MPRARRAKPQPHFDVLDREARIEEERRRAYYGSARVDLDALVFDKAPECQPSKQNVRRLLAAFEKAGCLRLPSRHHVPAIIARQTLEEAMANSALSSGDLFRQDLSECSTLLFPDDFRVHCLHGRHRIEAAKEHLPINDQWWIVDFYSPDLSPELRADLVQQNSNEQPPSVGEMFFRILDCDPADSRSIGFWWSQIHSQDEIAELRRLLKRPSLVAAFKQVARFPAFGRQMLPGNIGSLLRLKCDEEVIHGLCHIPKAWSRILDGISVAENRVDPYTVETMQMRSVKHCRVDRELLEPLVRRGTVFSNFRSHERQVIWRNLMAFSERIPSLAMFFEDFKYLEDVGDCIKELFDLPRGQTLSQTLDHSFVSRMGLGEMFQASGQGASRAGRFGLARRRLFVLTMQNLQSLRPRSILLGNDRDKTIIEATAQARHELAKEAHRLGFRSSKIAEELAKDPDRIEARRSLLRARDQRHFVYDENNFEALIDRLVATYAEAERIVPTHGPMVYVTDSNDGEPLTRRCGRPCQRAFVESAAFLTLENMHIDDVTGFGGLTSLFVRRDVYLFFFGPLENPLNEFRTSREDLIERMTVPREIGDQDPRGVDHEMLDPDEDDWNADNALALVRERLRQSDSASQYSQPLHEDLVVNTTDGVLVAAESEDHPVVDVSGVLALPEPPRRSASDAIETTAVPESIPSVDDITLVLHQGHEEQTSDTVFVDGRSPSAVEEVVAYYIQQGLYPFDTTFRALAIQQCFEAALADPDKTLFLMQRSDVTMSIAELLDKGLRKRPASEELHVRPHKRTMIVRE